jgi:uncharacterized protein (DUF1330 family)
MELTHHVQPTETQLAELMKMPRNEPYVMINIIRFKDKTNNGDETGWEAYARYAQHVMPFLQAAGGKLLWQGTIRHTIVGDTALPPDTVFLVQYPTLDHFLSMIQDPAYQEIARDRVAGLEFGGLYAARTDYSVFT